MVDKLLTLKEAAECLGLSEDEVRSLVKKGEIPAYQIGGTYLRFREDQILLAKPKYAHRTPVSSLPKTIEEDSSGGETFTSRLADFFYFNDFYIFSAVVIAALLFIIVQSIR